MAINRRATAIVAAGVFSLTVAAIVRTQVDLRAAFDERLRVPARLSETGLYLDGRTGVVDPVNRPFTPQYALWSDGAAKSRWVYLPPGSTIDAADEYAWELPVGTRFWKEFRFDGRRVETRMSWKVASGRWVFVSYVWNEGGTDATLAPADGLPGVIEVAPGRRHSIPSVADCHACHGSSRSRPLGFNVLQLSDDRDPEALHAEPSDPAGVTLGTLVREGRIAPLPTQAAGWPPRIRTADPDTRAVLGYLFANCGSCHDGSGEIAALGPVLRARELLDNGDAVARGLVDSATSWQAPGRSDGTTVIVDSRAPHESAVLLRMKSRRPSSQMPPLGTVVKDDEAVQRLERWVTALAAAHR
jgi:hypothetical protein